MSHQIKVTDAVWAEAVKVAHEEDSTPLAVLTQALMVWRGGRINKRKQRAHNAKVTVTSHEEASQ